MTKLHAKFRSIPSINLLRMPETPISLCFLVTRGPKLGKNRISTECGHDTFACQISGHSFHVFSSECPETPITLIFLHTIGLKLGQYWRKSNYFWKWSGYIIMPPFRPFLPCILFRMPGNPNFTKFVGHQRTKIGPVLAKTESFLEVVSLSMPYFLPFLLCVLLRMLRNVTGPTNRCTYVLTLTNVMSPSDFCIRDKKLSLKHQTSPLTISHFPWQAAADIMSHPSPRWDPQLAQPHSSSCTPLLWPRDPSH